MPAGMAAGSDCEGDVIDATNALDEILAHISDVTNDLDANERIMVLSAVSEHCKAYVETMLAHDYHRVLYGQKQVNKQ